MFGTRTSVGERAGKVRTLFGRIESFLREGKRRPLIF